MERGALALVDRDGTATLLRPRLEAFRGVHDLDSARLEHALADLPHVVRYQHGIGNVLAALSHGEAQAAVLVRPVGVAEIERTARKGSSCPPSPRSSRPSCAPDWCCAAWSEAERVRLS